jgi:hypothetical protein
MSRISPLISFLAESQLGIDIYSILCENKLLFYEEASIEEDIYLLLVKYFVVNNLHNKEIIQASYSIFFRRSPNDSEILYWTDLLDQDNIMDFLKNIIHSKESIDAAIYSKFKNSILQLYQKEIPSIASINKLIRQKDYISAYRLLPFLQLLDTPTYFIVEQKRDEIISRVPHKKIYIDITHYYYYRHNTGIQRVVKNLFDSFHSQNPYLGDYEVLPVAIKNDNIFVLLDYIFDESKYISLDIFNYTPILSSFYIHQSY